MVKKIMIIGPPGCGKTTFTKQLGYLLDYPIYHLDNLFWKKGWNPEKEDIFIHKVMEIIETEEWIIDGDYPQVTNKIIEKAERVILIDVWLPILLFNVIRRTIRGYFTREMICGENHEKIARLFMRDGIVAYTIKQYKHYKKVERRQSIINRKLFVVKGYSKK